MTRGLGGYSSHGAIAGDQGVSWTQQDGDLLKARDFGEPEASNADIISTQGAEVVRVESGRYIQSGQGSPFSFRNTGLNILLYLPVRISNQ